MSVISTLEKVEVGGSGHPQLLSEFKTSLGYMRPVFLCPHPQKGSDSVSHQQDLKFYILIGVINPSGVIVYRGPVRERILLVLVLGSFCFVLSVIRQSLSVALDGLKLNIDQAVLRLTEICLPLPMSNYS